MSSSDDVDLDEVYSFALALADKAGKMLDDAWRARCNGGQQTGHVEKESAVDIVTQTDEGWSDLVLLNPPRYPMAITLSLVSSARTTLASESKTAIRSLCEPPSRTYPRPC